MLPARPFYLIRHGQSEANVARITAGGKFDSPLTEKGRDQARALAPFMPQLEIKPGVLYHSSMVRAHETASIINEKLKLKMIKLQDLREHEMGDWDGQPWEKIEPLLERGDNPPNGESEPLFAQRIQVTLTGILTHAAEDPPLIVAHGGHFHAIGFLYEYAMSEVHNCHLHYFEPNSEWDKFPWRVWNFDIDGKKLVRKSAPFCLSQTLERLKAI
jgi:2,3-bisphosphoglycerate-dependent phosphoglycerate mutase